MDTTASACGPVGTVLPFWQTGVTILCMKGVTIKLPEATLRRLREEASESGRSVASLVRERVEAPYGEPAGSVYDLAADLAGSVGGSRRAATNARRRFRR